MFNKMVNLYFLFFLFLSIFLFLVSLYLLNFNYFLILELDLVYISSSAVTLTFLIDWVSIIFVSLVFYISSMIMKYSEEYMHSEYNPHRFFLLVILFVISMMFMILSPNFISILLGWDGLGLVSYILVIYYQNEKSFNAGMLTALSNRVGDAALLMSIAMMVIYGGWNFFVYLEIYNKNMFFWISLFVILAAMTKSAQIPFSSWLPSAMAAPTPVSSLVHSSTLVTAGVYLLFRFSSYLSFSMMNMLMFISLITMFMAGLCANFEFDLKKIIAFSTLSQLGMMIFIYSLGDLNLAFFHLLIHASFKALLFMCAGAIIHNLMNCQDIRYMGGLVNFMPMVCTCFLVSNLALCGVPFLSGFYSKDLIAEAFSMKYVNMLIYVVFYVSIGLTVSYSVRLSYLVLFNKFSLLNLSNIEEKNNFIMLKGMIGLVILVILKGSALMWMLFPTPMVTILPFYLKMLTLMMILIGFILGKEFYCMKLNYTNKTMKFILLASFLSSMWNMPFLSTFGCAPYILNMSKSYFKKMDRGWMEYYGSVGLMKLLLGLIKCAQKLSINHIKFLSLIFFTLNFSLILYLLLN